MNNVSKLILLTALFAGCAQQVRQVFNEKDVDTKNHGIFWGAMLVNYEGKARSSECNLIFSHDKQDFVVSLDQNGKFMGSAPEGKIFLKSLSCQADGTFSKKHVYNFGHEEIHFMNKAGDKKTYIGDFKMDWKQSGLTPKTTAVGGSFGILGWSPSNKKISINRASEADRGPASVGEQKKSQTSLLTIPESYSVK